MNLFKVEHGKLNTDDLVHQFIAFMHVEFPSYIDVDNNEVSAHNEGDFDWFVSEFMKSQK